MDFTSTPSAAAQTMTTASHASGMTCSSHASGMTWRIPGWAWIAISLAVTAEAAINALRAYGLGQHLEHFTVDVPVYGIPTPVTVSLAGAVLVLAAIAISLAQARAAYVAFRPGALARQRVLAAPVALLLLAVSVTALSLTLLEAQRGKTGDEGGQRTAYDTAKGAYDKADEELRRLEGTRTTAEVRAAMDAAPVSRLVFRRTAECTDMTREDSFEACKPILDLRQEMARAIRKLELEQALPGLKATLTATPRPAEATWVEAWAASIWSWIMGLAVVAVATFGAPLFAEPSGAVAGGRPKRRQSAERSAVGQLMANHPALLRNSAVGTETASNGSANGSANGSRPDDGGAVVIALPVTPNRPGPSNGSAAPAPEAANGSATQRAEERAARKADVLAFVREEAALGHVVESQCYLAETLGMAESSLSDILRELEAEGLIERRGEGRRKIITVPNARALVAAD